MKNPDLEPVASPPAKVALSTASVYPENPLAAFEMASRLGYDGIEVMVMTDEASQSASKLRELSDKYELPIVAVHAPCLLVTQRVWGTEPWGKLVKSKEVAEELGAQTVVVHPPFRWQRDYGRDFVQGIRRMQDETDVLFAVENMYPWRARSREMAAYAPGWDIREEDYPHATLDMSHTAVSGTDALVMAQELGDALAHIHLTDGVGSNRDEHLVPGRGSQRCGEVLEYLAQRDFRGSVVVEISTRKAANRAEREADLVEALAYARLHLVKPVPLGIDPEGRG